MNGSDEAQPNSSISNTRNILNPRIGPQNQTELLSLFYAAFSVVSLVNNGHQKIMQSIFFKGKNRRRDASIFRCD